MTLRPVDVETVEPRDLQSVFGFGPLELRPNEGLVSASGVALHLSVREFGLLVELARNDGRIVRREEIYEAVWGEPLRVPADAGPEQEEALRVELEARLNAATAQADALCGHDTAAPAAARPGRSRRSPLALPAPRRGE